MKILNVIYEYPESYNWNEMPYNMATRTTSSLLYDIAIRANATFGLDGTSTTLTNMKNALQSYGYKYNGIGVFDHSAHNTWSEIKEKHPVCMSGEIDGIGHAWIASGGTYMNGDVEYYVYTFRERFDFYPVYKYVDSGMQYYYFYMNWGWYGGYNGSYLDTAKDPVYGEEITDRRDIYGIEPNN